jgi:Cu/Ag efflux pump CusA
MLSGSKAAIAIKIFGVDLEKMYKMGNDIKSEISGIEGLVDIIVEQQVNVPQIKIKPKDKMLAAYGISMKEFLNFVDIGFAGEQIGNVFEDERMFPLIIRLDKKERSSINDLKNALIKTPNHGNIPLSYVADITSSSGPNKINRENVKRKLVVSANVSERDVRSIVNDIKEIIGDKIDIPQDYYIEYGGQFESEEKASRTLVLASLFSLLLIFMLLYQEFKDVSTTSIVLLNLPLALIGGVFAIYFTSGELNIPAIIGFITLFGIATRNGILLISRYNALIAEGMHWKEAIQKGSVDRLIPILMTALTAALALIPMAMSANEAGNEIQSPMAIVILGGLLSSTLLNVFILPIVFWIKQENLNKKL